MFVTNQKWWIVPSSPPISIGWLKHNAVFISSSSWCCSALHFLWLFISSIWKLSPIWQSGVEPPQQQWQLPKGEVLEELQDANIPYLVHSIHGKLSKSIHPRCCLAVNHHTSSPKIWKCTLYLNTFTFVLKIIIYDNV